ncbi:hypothetical protein V6N13_000892 [Hibiscus sabdariffa]|uniref:Uncharacterized protein n=1 Tax=Hibiscus sabdariffa TaxID=183260 RepID=A0ABR2G6N9_9ROSI
MGFEDNSCTALIFMSDTLKLDFSNNVLLHDLKRTRDVIFKGSCQTTYKYLLVCWFYCVDELENTVKGHYEQRLILLMAVDKGNKEDEEVTVAVAVAAEAYYTHKSFEKEMWMKNRGKGLGLKI